MENLQIPTKFCKCCQQEKPLTEFGKNTAMPDGIRCTCKECTNKQAKENRIKRIAANLTVKDAPSVEKNSALSAFTPRQLILELRARGYRGTLELVTVQTIKI